MSRHLSVATAIEKNKLASDKAFVLLLSVDIVTWEGDFVETLRLARNSENVSYKGHVYNAANFDASLDETVDEAATLQIDAEDPSGYIRDRMTYFHGGTGSSVTLTVVNTGNLEQPPEIEETFELIEASQTGYRVSFKMGVENLLTVRFPNLTQFKDQCTKTYKGPRCKYAGAMESCSFTYDGPNGCKAHENTANFGGLRGLQRLGV